MPRHPSQLYQFGLEGLLLFVVLWIYTQRRRPLGAVSGCSWSATALCRFIAEYAREPDSFLGFLALRPHDGPVAVAADDRRSAPLMLRMPTGAPARREPTVLDRMK